MHKLYFLSSILICFLSARVFGQAADHSLLEWNEFYSLSWEDFEGSPSTESIGDAGTAVRIKAKPFYIKKQVHYDVIAYFDRKKSWVRGKSEALLAHERLHFDIAELYARKIRKKIAELQANDVNDIQTFNAAIREILEESNEADQRYDLETLHGALQKKQSMWEKRVKEELQGLKDYKKNKRIVSTNTKRELFNIAG
jgi:hypothetical protein